MSVEDLMRAEREAWDRYQEFKTRALRLVEAERQASLDMMIARQAWQKSLSDLRSATEARDDADLPV